MMYESQHIKNIIVGAIELAESNGAFGTQDIIRAVLCILADWSGDSLAIAIENDDMVPTDNFRIECVQAAIIRFDKMVKEAE